MEDYQKDLTGKPWFWGKVGMFITPWFKDFDPSKTVITKLLIWFRLPTVPAHLWHFLIFKGIGNALAHYLSTYTYRGHYDLYTYIRICGNRH